MLESVLPNPTTPPTYGKLLATELDATALKGIEDESEDTEKETWSAEEGFEETPVSPHWL
jgi:hypothetical protein